MTCVLFAVASFAPKCPAAPPLRCSDPAPPFSVVCQPPPRFDPHAGFALFGGGDPLPTYAKWPFGLADSGIVFDGQGADQYPLGQEDCPTRESACIRLPASGHHNGLRALLAPARLMGQSSGFPLNINPFMPPRTTNFPPLSQDIASSTSPLTSTAAQRRDRPLFLANRETIAGTLDAITCQPLLREVDLELPLGAATFRLIRTYGGNATGFESHFHGSSDDVPFGTGTKNVDQPAQAKLWDWAGVGWMMSENPVLLFDAQYVEHDANLTRRCYAIMDAHHSIPFIQDQTTGNYASPAWFDATLTWSESEAEWTPPNGQQPGRWRDGPEHLILRTHGGAIKYRFSVQYKNMPRMFARDPDEYGPGSIGVSAHLGPKVENGNLALIQPGATGQGTSGPGLPYIALLTSVEDSYGNRVEIEHTPTRTARIDQVTAGCISCVQNCTENGQIRTVRLYRAGQSAADWTLLYVHRAFRNWQPDFSAWQLAYDEDPSTQCPPLFTEFDASSRWFNQNAIHAIYAYRGDITITHPASGSWTLPPELFKDELAVSGLVGFDDIDWEQKTSVTLNCPLPPGWTYRVLYTYDEVYQPALTEPRDHGELPAIVSHFGTPESLPRYLRWGTPLESGVYGEEPGRRVNPHLLRVQTRAKDDKEPSPNDRSNVYMYCTTRDERHAWAMRSASVPTDAEYNDLHTSTLVGYAQCPEALPQLKHVIREEGISHAISDGVFKHELEVFSPDPDTVSGVPRNRQSYEKYAAITLEWSPLYSSMSYDVPSVQFYPSGGPWLHRLVSEECVLNVVARERIVRTPAAFSVSRMKLRGSDQDDGIYDLLRMHVMPSRVVPSDLSSWTFPPGIRLAAVDTDSVRRITINVPGTSEPTDEYDFGLPDMLYFGAYASPSYWQTLFPFSWQPLNAHCPVGSFVRPASSLDEPTYLTLVDRHDGFALGQVGLSDPRRYSQKVLMARRWCDSNGSTSCVADRPAHRQLVGLNGSGFKLFERTWDYVQGGVAAKGPTEEFLYEATQFVTPNGELSTHPSNAAPFSVVLKEHRTLGQGISCRTCIRSSSI